MKTLIFRPIPEDDGSYLEEPEYAVLLDNVQVCTVRSDDMDLRANALNPLWEKLNLKVEFDDDCLME